MGEKGGSRVLGGGGGDDADEEDLLLALEEAVGVGTGAGAGAGAGAAASFFGASSYALPSLAPASSRAVALPSASRGAPPPLALLGGDAGYVASSPSAVGGGGGASSAASSGPAPRPPDLLLTPVHLSRIRSLESNASSRGGTDSEDDFADPGDRRRAGKLLGGRLRIGDDVFRPPSRSPSKSPEKRRSGGRPPSPGGGSTAAGASGSAAALSPTERSIASDSTDGASNLTARRRRRPSAALPSGSPPFRSPTGSPEDRRDGSTGRAAGAAAGAVLGRVVEGCGGGVGDDAGVSPLRDSPNDGEPTGWFVEDGSVDATTKRKRGRKGPNGKGDDHRDERHPKRHPKKNNLVIQPSPSSSSLRPAAPTHPSAKKKKRRPHGGRKQHSRSLSADLPPPHPLSHRVRSHPPVSPPPLPSDGSGRSPALGGRGAGGSKPRQRPHARSETFRSSTSTSTSGHSRDHSSACDSEATPVISPSRRGTFSFSSAESLAGMDHDVDRNVDRNDSTNSSGLSSAREDLRSRLTDLADDVAGTTASDLRGIDVSFGTGEEGGTSPGSPTAGEEERGEEDGAEEEEDDVSLGTSAVDDRRAPPAPRRSPRLSPRRSPRRSPRGSPRRSPRSSPRSSPVPTSYPYHPAVTASFPPSPLARNPKRGRGERSGYGGEDCFARTARSPPEHTRQFSSDDRFFEAIHDGGLQSLSFETVVDAELSACAEKEIELVYDSDGGGGNRRWSDGSADGSVGGRSAEGELQREELKRILQWRRGRERVMSGATEREVRTEEKEGNEEKVVDDDDDNDDDDENGMELVPLNSSLRDEENDTGNGNGNARPTAAKQFHRLPVAGSLGRRWRSPLAYVRNRLWWWQGWWWHLPQGNDFDDGAATPKKGNLSPVPQFNADGREDEDDGDESRGLTSPAPWRRRKRSRRYDDVDFDRDDRCCRLCSSSCCGDDGDRYGYTDGFQRRDWATHSRWKRLLGISGAFLLLAWVFSNGKLEKHVDGMYDDGSQDPLAREHFLDAGRTVDDEDDYYTSHLMEGFGDDEDRFYSNYVENDHRGQNDDAGIAAGAVADLERQPQSLDLNDLSGIDTIVVLGSRHAGKDWLVDRLNKLYPSTNVIGEFPDVPNHGVPRRHPRARHARIIDPMSHQALGSADGDARRKSKSAHVLVVAVFVNPYDWIELMRVDPDLAYSVPTRGRDAVDWEGFVAAELPGMNGTIFELRAAVIRSSVMDSLDRDGVKVVLPCRYEDLVDAYDNYDNYVRPSDASYPLPGIVGLVDQIQSRTGLRPDPSAGWKEPRKNNPFWADPIGCQGHICHMSIHNMREDASYIRYVNRNADWESEDRIGYQKKSVPKPSVDQIVVLGERHSGAEWLVDRLAKSFPGIPVQYGFSRPGKWFQAHPSKTIPDTLVVSVFLNAYDWVELMRQHPINAPAHKDMGWSEFVTSWWTRKRSKLDESLSNTASAECSLGFFYEEVVPCMTQRDPRSDSFPVYELRPPLSGLDAGEPYSTILELRADKILNFLGVSEFSGVVDSIPVRYEDLVWDESYTDDASYVTLPFPGIAGLLEKIRDRTALVPDASAGWIIDEEEVFRAAPLGVGVTNLDPYYVKWMEDHIDWDVEMLIGYSQ